MGIFFIADTHFDDENIMNYENRPFRNVKTMNSAIVENWNRTVGDDDIVYFVGDVGNPDYVKELSGHKYLVLGNHDKLSIEDYHNYGFEKVYDVPIILNDFWIVSHEPMYVNTNMPYANIFGHVHGNPVYNTVSARSFCVSVERVNYAPISFESIAVQVAELDEKDKGSN